MQVNWAETPGGYYAIAYVLSICLMVLNSPRRWSRKKSCLIAGGFGIFLYTFMSFTPGKPEWLFISTMLVIIIMMWGMVHMLCKYDAMTSFYFTIRAFIIGEFIASLEFQIFYYVIKFKLLPLTYMVNMILLVLVDGILLAVLYRLEKKNREVNESIQINQRELLSAMVVGVAIYVASNLSYVFESVSQAHIVINQLYTIRTLVDLGGIAILYAYHVQLGELNTRFEVQRLQDMLEMQHNNYEMLRQSVDVVNQKYHDLKYQISVLKSDIDSKAGREYLEQMEGDIKAYEAQNKTGNKVLDTILTGKSLYCQNNWIELTSVADGHALDFMDQMDVSILFGNMLDNAIESVSKIENKEKRLIHLAITKQKGFLRIRMENCYGEKLNIENGVIKSSKANHKYHGFGLKSIENMVKKYGGSTTIQVENGWFELRILIPIQND